MLTCLSHPLFEILFLFWSWHCLPTLFHGKRLFNLYNVIFFSQSNPFSLHHKTFNISNQILLNSPFFTFMHLYQTIDRNYPLHLNYIILAASDLLFLLLLFIYSTSYIYYLAKKFLICKLENF